MSLYTKGKKAISKTLGQPQSSKEYDPHKPVETPRDKFGLRKLRKIPINLSKARTQTPQENRNPNLEATECLVAGNKLNGSTQDGKGCTLLHLKDDSVEVAHLWPHSQWYLPGTGAYIKIMGLVRYDARDIVRLNGFKSSEENIIWLDKSHHHRFEAWRGELMLVPPIEKLIYASDQVYSQWNEDEKPFSEFSPYDLLKDWTDKCIAEESKKKRTKKSKAKTTMKGKNCFEYDIWFNSSKQHCIDNEFDRRLLMVPLRFKDSDKMHQLEVSRKVKIAPRMMPLEFFPAVDQRKLLLNVFIAILILERTMHCRQKGESSSSARLVSTQTAKDIQKDIEYFLRRLESQHVNDYETCKDIKEARRKKGLNSAPKFQGTSGSKREYCKGGYYAYYKAMEEAEGDQDEVSKEGTNASNAEPNENDQVTKGVRIDQREQQQQQDESQDTNIEGSQTNLPARSRSREDDPSGGNQDDSPSSTNNNADLDQTGQTQNQQRESRKRRSTKRNDFIYYNWNHTNSVSDSQQSRDIAWERADDSLVDKSDLTPNTTPYTSEDGVVADTKLTSSMTSSPKRPLQLAAATNEKIKKTDEMDDAVMQMSHKEIDDIFKDIESFSKQLFSLLHVDEAKQWAGKDYDMKLYNRLNEAEEPYLLRLDRCVFRAFFKKEAEVGTRFALRWIRSHERHEYDDEVDRLYLEWKRHAVSIWRQSHVMEGSREYHSFVQSMTA